MIHNPEAEARQESEEAHLTGLQAENSALRSQLQRLEGEHAAATSNAVSPSLATGATSIALGMAEITLLKRKVLPHSILSPYGPSHS